MHGTTFPMRNTFPPAEQLANNTPDCATAHECESVATVGSNEMIGFGDGVLDADRHRFLACGEVAEATDFLLLVQPVGGHLHSPHGHHVVVHLLKFGFGCLKGVRRRVELVGLKGFIREFDLEGFVVLL